MAGLTCRDKRSIYHVFEICWHRPRPMEGFVLFEREVKSQTTTFTYPSHKFSFQSP